MNARAIFALGSLLLLVGFLRWRRDVEPEPWDGWRDLERVDSV